MIRALNLDVSTAVLHFFSFKSCSQTGKMTLINYTTSKGSQKRLQKILKNAGAPYLFPSRFTWLTVLTDITLSRIVLHLTSNIRSSLVCSFRLQSSLCDCQVSVRLISRTGVAQLPVADCCQLTRLKLNHFLIFELNYFYNKQFRVK